MLVLRIHSFVPKGVERLTTNMNKRGSNQLHKQIGGASMRSPLDPILADIIMTNIEWMKLKHETNDIILHRMYVNDRVILKLL